MIYNYYLTNGDRFLNSLLDGVSVAKRQSDYTFKEETDFYDISVDLPGYSKENISIEIDGFEDTLKIVAKSDVRPIKEFTFYVPSTNQDKIEATLVNGVLTVKAHKTEAIKPRKIAIK